MTNQVNQAFEDFVKNEYDKNANLKTENYSQIVYIDDEIELRWMAWQVATKASESEINSLKEQVKELEDEVIKYQSIVSEQKIIIHAIKGECKDMGVTDICVALGRKDTEIVELQAHVNQLLEALETAK